MHARIPPKMALSTRTKGIISEYAAEEMDRQRVDMMRRFFKLMALALHDPLTPKSHGMGTLQITRVINRISHYTSEAEGNPDFWDEVDEAVINKMGLPFDREPCK